MGELGRKSLGWIETGGNLVALAFAAAMIAATLYSVVVLVRYFVF